tara:strand:+ start:21413 stop:22699 length:1287 start_codon:yes stop_codon:yes gene_type:complete
MQKYIISKSKLSGIINSSPSKSHSIRAILFSGLAKGTSIIHNYLNSPDIKAMLQAVEQLGAKIIKKKDTLEITGFNLFPKTPDDIIDAGNSGQVLRFIAAIASLAKGYTVITGDHSIRYNRPIKPLIEGLNNLGVFCVSSKQDGFAPVIIKGPVINSTTYLDGQDSQPVSALLILSAFLEHNVIEINVRNPGEIPWVNLTLGWLDKFNIKYVNNDFKQYKIFGHNKINHFDYTVPGDFSSVLYPVIAALITNSNITIKNLDSKDLQGDKKVIDILIKMGADVKYSHNNLIVNKSLNKLLGLDIDVNDFIDAVPILAVLGCFVEGETRLTNAAIARRKESDRLTVITQELRKMGANIIEQEDSLIIKKSILKNNSNLESHNDHRIAMSLAVAALNIEGESSINNISCVSKSYNKFYDDLQSLGVNIKYG